MLGALKIPQASPRSGPTTSFWQGLRLHLDYSSAGVTQSPVRSVWALKTPSTL